MGRLQVEIRHGSNGPAQWGAVVALIVLVLFAAAGHHEIAAMLHTVLAVVEIAAFSAVGLGILAVALVIARARRRSRRRQQHLEERAARAWVLSDQDGRPALDQVRPDVSWPETQAEWDEIERRAAIRRAAIRRNGADTRDF